VNLFLFVAVDVRVFSIVRRWRRRRRKRNLFFRR